MMHTPRRRTAIGLLLGVCAVALATSLTLLGRPAVVSAQLLSPVGLCLNDAGTAELKQYVTTLVTATDPATASRREAIGLFPGSAADVTVETDTTLCRRAAVASRAILAPADTFALLPVDVIRAGTSRYVVRDGSGYNPSSEWLTHIVFDTSFTAVHTFSR